MFRLNFLWLIENEVAGHSQPSGMEDLVWLYEKGIRALVRMSEEPLVTQSQIIGIGMDDLYEPVVDFSGPTLEQLDKMVDFIMKSVWNKKPVGVSCDFGVGRTGTVLACYWAKRNITARGIIIEVRRKRPGAVETQEQVKAVEDYLRHINDTNRPD